MFQKLSTFLTLFPVLSVANSLSSSSGCYEYYKEISSRTFMKFDLGADKDCWDYCKYEDQCKLFSVPKQHDNRTCSLYKENEITVKYTGRYSSTIFASKTCMLLKLSLNNTQGMNTLESSLKNGVVIYKADRELCLEADFDNVSALPEYGCPVYWTSNCGGAKKWELNCTSEQGVMGGCSRARVKVRDHLEYCLTFLTREDIWTASMLPCFDGTHNKCSCKEKYQDLILTGWGMKNWKIGSMTRNLTKVFASLPSESPWNLTRNYTLDNVELIPKEKLLNTPCKNVSVLNGQVLQSDAVPMFLPGEEMTVQCNPGYGAKFDNGSYLTVYNVTCWMFPSLIDCSPLTTELNFEDSKALSSSTMVLAQKLSLCLIIIG